MTAGTTPDIQATDPIVAADPADAATTWVIEFRAHVQVTGAPDNKTARETIQARGFPRHAAAPVSVIAEGCGGGAPVPDAAIGLLRGGDAFEAELRAFMTVQAPSLESALALAKDDLTNDALFEADTDVEFHIENLRPA